MKIISRTDRAFAGVLKRITGRGRIQSAGVEKSVKAILNAVEHGGDRAILRFTKQFDRVSLKWIRSECPPMKSRMPITTSGRMRETRCATPLNASFPSMNDSGQKPGCTKKIPPR